MKGLKKCNLAVSVLAGSTAALAASSSATNEVSMSITSCCCEGSNSSRGGGDKEKFAPRFDGLRFIETLITAHR